MQPVFFLCFCVVFHLNKSPHVLSPLVFFKGQNEKSENIKLHFRMAKHIFFRLRQWHDLSQHGACTEMHLRRNSMGLGMMPAWLRSCVLLFFAWPAWLSCVLLFISRGPAWKSCVIQAFHSGPARANSVAPWNLKPIACTGLQPTVDSLCICLVSEKVNLREIP